MRLVCLAFHRYEDRAARRLWQLTPGAYRVPGDVPEEVARLLARRHPGKFRLEEQTPQPAEYRASVVETPPAHRAMRRGKGTKRNQ